MALPGQAADAAAGRLSGIAIGAGTDVAIASAGGILAPIGFVMPMWVGAVLMSLSTVVVALNAQLLRRIDLSPESSTRSVLER